MREKEQAAASCEMALKVVTQASSISSKEDLHYEVRFLFWALPSCTRRLVSHCCTQLRWSYVIQCAEISFLFAVFETWALPGLGPSFADHAIDVVTSNWKYPRVEICDLSVARPGSSARLSGGLSPPLFSFFPPGTTFLQFVHVALLTFCYLQKCVSPVRLLMLAGAETHLPQVLLSFSIRLKNFQSGSFAARPEFLFPFTLNHLRCRTFSRALVQISKPLPYSQLRSTLRHTLIAGNITHLQCV